MALTQIRLPVLRSLRISDYQLIPGKDRNGFTHVFKPGVTVIAGVNSLGKTTLLNIMMRLLLGDKEPRKSEQRDIGSGVHEMVSKQNTMFADRVLDEAVEAAAEGEFSFGNDIVVVRRSLKDLTLESLHINGKPILGDGDTLQQRLVRLSGSEDEFDFDFLIRSFTFFLEEKSSLIWNERGQFEVFRILCLTPSKARKYAELADEISKKDSEYRNKRVPLRRLRRELEAAIVATGNQKTLRQELDLLDIRSTGIREQLDELNTEISKRLSRKATLLEKAARVSLELEIAGRELEQKLEAFFANAFPSLPDSVKIILGQLTTGKGCAVCNNDDPDYTTKYRSLAEKGYCPFCERPAKTTKKIVPRSKFEAAKLNDLEQKVTKLRHSLDALQGEIGVSETERDSLLERKRALTEEALNVDNKREQLRLRLPPSQAELDEKWRFVRKGEKELADIYGIVEERSRELEALLKDARKTLRELQEGLTKRFQHYAGHFLAESCRLEWVTDRRRIGQEDPMLEYPALSIYMTSGASGEIETQRIDESQVSESQKEFIDLAFRMALFDVVKQKGQRAMLVIETPEASLDSVFVDSAGDLLRRFAEGERGKPNVVIATTNLNGSRMIRSLLGLDTPAAPKRQEDVGAFVINMLEEAAPNAAVRAYGRRYRAELKRALALPTRRRRSK